ncbi:MAG: YybH family protein, partial [Rhodothermales bacterium]
LPPELDRVLRDYEQGWRDRDADALAALFTPDGFVLRAGHPPVRGRTAIAEAYQGSGGPLHLHAFAFAEADSVAYIIGGYRAAPARPDAGKFILTLRRGPDGQWLIAADMDNQNG